MALLNLPLELQLMIAEYLSVTDLLRLRASHRHFHTVLASLWLEFATQPKGNPPRPALIWAAQKGQELLVRLLLSVSGSKKHAIDVNVRYFQETALHIAVSAGHEQITRMLLESGADIEALDPVYTPLFVSCRTIRASVGIVRGLLKKGAAIKLLGDSALHHAAGTGLTEVVRILIEEGGADINALNKYRQTPLMVAISRHQDNIAMLLLEMGADPCLREHGSSPLAKAIERRAEPLIRMIFKKLFLLFPQSSRGELVQNFRSHDYWCFDGKHALGWAVSVGDVAIAKYMISIGVPVTGINEYMETLLHIASQIGHGDTIRLLLDAHAAVDARDYSGWTPLHFAARNMHADATAVLLSRGADPNAQNDCGITALHWAVQNSGEHAVETVQLLLEQGADASVTGSGGETPLEWAMEFGGDERIVQMLLSRLERLSEGFPQGMGFIGTSEARYVGFLNGQHVWCNVCLHVDYGGIGTCCNCNDVEATW